MNRKMLNKTLSLLMVFLAVFGLFLPITENANAASDDIIISIPEELIEDCGNQASSGNTKACQAYAFTYCRIILDNKAHKWTEYRYKGQSACAPSVAGYNDVKNVSSEQDILKIIYENINLGRPVVLRARGSSLFHYVVAVGYKKDCNPKALKQSDFTILDPWDGTTKNLTEVPLKKTQKGYYGYFSAKSGGAEVAGVSSEKTYTVTFDPTGGSVSPTTKTVTEGKTLYGLPEPKRDGYEFVNWSTTPPNTSGMLVSDGVLEVDQDMTLYAVWRVKCTTHTYKDKDEICIKCGKMLPYDNQFNSGDKGTYEVIVDSVWIRSGPYQTKSEVRKITNGQTVDVVGSVVNSYGNKWLKTADGSYVYSEKVALRTATNYPPETDEPKKPEGPHTHVKGERLFCEKVHPHYVYYKCAVCGESFTDGTKEALKSCERCWGSWSSWSTTPVYASDTRQVESRQVKVSDGYTEYRYGRYVDSTGTHDCWCGTYLEGLSYISGNASLQYSNWSTKRYSTSGKGWSCGRCGAYHIGVDHTGSDGRDWWAEYLLPNGSYYWEESRTTSAEYRTEYRYRDLIKS